MIVVFLGPSLDVMEAERILPTATFRPPAKQGDIASILSDGPAAIGLIDGEFHQSRSVWHKEILLALDRGVHVFGSSSMGALRAAELHTFGMVGIGAIFEAYATGDLIDDDEVALLYSRNGAKYIPLSEPMVNIRATIDAGLCAGVLGNDLAHAALDEAKLLHYPLRTRADVIDRLRKRGLDGVDELARYWRDHAVNQKAEDARSLLRTLHSFAADPPPPRDSVGDLHWTASLNTLYDRERRVRILSRDALGEASGEVPLADVAEFVQLHHEDPDRLGSAAMNRALVGVLATLLEIRPREEQVDDELDRWRSRHGLEADAALDAWRRENHLTAEELRELAAEAASSRLLARWLMYCRQAERNTRLVLDHLRWENEYTLWAARAAAAFGLLDESDEEGIDTFLLSDPQLAAREHRRWTGLPLSTGLDAWAEEAGFNTSQDLFLAFARAKAVRVRLLERLQEALTARESHRRMT